MFNFSQYNDFIVPRQDRTSIDVPAFDFIGCLLMHLGCFQAIRVWWSSDSTWSHFFLLCQMLKWQNISICKFENCLPFTFEGANSIETNLQTCNLWTSHCSAKVIIIMQARLQRAAGKSDTVNHVRFLYICKALDHLSYPTTW